MCGGFRSLCKTKDMPSKAFKYGEHSTKNRFYLFPTFLVICFCFFVDSWLHLKNNDHEMFVLEVYLAHDFCLKRAKKTEKNVHFQKLLSLDAQADRPTTVKGRFLVKNDI